MYLIRNLCSNRSHFEKMHKHVVLYFLTKTFPENMATSKSHAMREGPNLSDTHDSYNTYKEAMFMFPCAFLTTNVMCINKSTTSERRPQKWCWQQERVKKLMHNCCSASMEKQSCFQGNKWEQIWSWFQSYFIKMLKKWRNIWLKNMYQSSMKNIRFSC